MLLVVQVVSHMMPDLPNVGLERDIEQFIVSQLDFYSSNAQLHLCNINYLLSLLHHFSIVLNCFLFYHYRNSLKILHFVQMG